MILLPFAECLPADAERQGSKRGPVGWASQGFGTRRRRMGRSFQFTKYRQRCGARPPQKCSTRKRAVVRHPPNLWDPRGAWGRGRPEAAGSAAVRDPAATRFVLECLPVRVRVTVCVCDCMCGVCVWGCACACARDGVCGCVCETVCVGVCMSVWVCV